MKKIAFILEIVLIISLLFSYYQKLKSNETMDVPKMEVSKFELFSKYYSQAQRKLQEMSIDEKISSLFLVRYPKDNGVNIQRKYQFGGYIFFAKDFKNKKKEEVLQMIGDVQKVSKIPMLIAVDEEGGKVVRVSSNYYLANETFKSSQELYREGGLKSIYEDTLNKSALLSSLKINLNLAPVVDIAKPNDYIYERTLGQNSLITSEYAKTVILASQKNSVSYTLKHFPGYGRNKDTHQGMSIDMRSKWQIIKELMPFKVGIDNGAEAIMINHNIIKAIDSNNPASLSIKIHNLLRNDLSFTGIIMTDDISMQALSDISNINVKALLAGNNLIITSNYQESIEEVKIALKNGQISQELIDECALKILAWKYYKGLLS